MDWLKKIFHRHKYKTLVIHPPHSHRCAQEQCKENDDYGFTMQCACGHTELTKLPSTIKEIFNVPV